MNNFSNQKLHEILNEELSVMNSLVEILKKEQTILVENQALLLEDLTTEKNTVLVLLGEVGKKRTFEFSSLQISDNQNNINDFIESSLVEDTIKKTWNELLSISSKAQEMNKTNGILINRQYNLNQNALNILQQTNTNESLYGSNGQSKINPATGRGYVVG
jgi:flagella synthesis protein FlgN